MKKTIILFLLASFFTGTGLSQKAKFGVFIDPMITWLSPDSRNVISEGVSMGVNGGLAIDNYFQKNYAVHTGISIGTQAGSLKFGQESYINAYGETDTLPAGTTVDYRMNYITVPLGLKLKSNQIGYFSYYALIGFTNQFNVKAHGTSNEGTLEKSDIIEEINLYNLAYHFGAGVEYAISKDTAITLGIVYHNGFLDVTHNSNAKVYSRLVSIRLGVMF
jgi:opacity protein-like surface antigen